MKLLLILAISSVLNNVDAKTNSTQIVEPVHVKTGFYIKSIDIESNQRYFNVDFYFWFRYPKSLYENKTLDLIENRSQIEFINGVLSSFIIDDGYIIGEEYYVTGRGRGKFTYQSDFSIFPFDSIRLPLTIEHVTLTSNDILFVADSASVNRSPKQFGKDNPQKLANIGDLKSVKSTYESTVIDYNTDFGEVEGPPITSYSRLSYIIIAERDYVSFMLKAFIPLIIVLSLSYLVFYIPSKELELAGGLSATSLLAAIAFQWTVNSSLPKYEGLILIDFIFYIAYLLIMLSMLQTVYTYNLEHYGTVTEEKIILSYRLEIAGRILYPAIFILAICVMFLFMP